MLADLRKILDLFEGRERLGLLALLCVIVVTALAQMAGVASIMPFMALVADPTVVTRHRVLSRVYAMFHFTNMQHFVIAVGFGVLILILVNNVLSALTTWLTLRLVWNKNHSLSVRLLRKYLSQPYVYFLNCNTSDLSKNILGEVNSVITGILIPVLNALARAVMVTALIALLVVVDVRLAVTIGLGFGGAYGVIYLGVRRRQGRIGRERLHANTLRFKTAAEAFGGIKELKVTGREDHFLRRFTGPSALFSRHMANNQIVSAVPRYVMEPVAFGGALVIILLSLMAGRNVTHILPIVSLFAFAGYRMMPALQQVFLGVTSLRFNRAALHVLHADLLEPNRHPPVASVPERIALPQKGASALAFTRAIELRKVTFRYPECSTPALEGIDLVVPKNGQIALVGATGSGKTTLVDVLLGLLVPQEGQVLVDGAPVNAAMLPGWKRLVGYVPQHIFLCDDTLARNIAFGMPDDEIDMAAVERAAKIANLHEAVGSLADGYHTVVGERGVRLSGGQRQRIGIARALYNDPELIIFDEATSALDGITEAAVMEAIHNIARAKTLVMIAHRLSSVRDCDAIYMLDKGRIVQSGTYDELIGSSSVFRAMAGGAA
ncbi:MAG TPA: ABC transporter ATP-binding protein [Gemmatimonadaceae bacterium]|nr:ABC transporter ATP-binding protein [Gemmatimonadaceae bacterium]